jgi:hypothetical protein
VSHRIGALFGSSDYSGTPLKEPRRPASFPRKYMPEILSFLLSRLLPPPRMEITAR